MDDHEELPLDHGYFDIGLTSLRLTDLRAHLEELLGISIDATVLFSQPTVEQLVSYLTDAPSNPSTDEEACNVA
ncbi:acyl carrier protein [Streptomyces sp. NPDC050534]|uniref:acyl carrier protein n=1 Tax=Streptomyces sp. NPDC050534 TaxID=3365625 RepID=UPI0037A8B864